jgi:hypothetical protein
MVPSRMLRLVALVRTDISEELGASFIRVTRIGGLGTKLAVTNTKWIPIPVPIPIPLGISSQRASVSSYS